MTADHPRKDDVKVTPPAARRSLNEIEVMGKRAARGVGLPWGIAEEAGKAARWLILHGFEAAKPLTNVLIRHDQPDDWEPAPRVVDGIWQARKGPLCPLLTGAALSDLASTIAEGQGIELGEAAEPLLLAPYAAAAAKLADSTLTLSFEEMTLVLLPNGEAAIEGNQDMLAARTARRVTLKRSGEPSVHTKVLSPVSREGLLVDAEAWARLNVFAMRTYAPATEASRLKGAGAGLRDNN